MMRFEIAPALEPEEWRHHRCGAVFTDRIDGETHVLLTKAHDEAVSIIGPGELFALLALANDALPDGDPRKFTLRDADWFRSLADDAESARDALALREWSARMARVFGALLPPARQ